MPSSAVDRHINDEVRDFLFFNKCKPRISDLAAINIVRGRDHGVPAYCYYLEYCSKIKIQNWTDMNKFISTYLVNKLKKIYKYCNLLFDI